MSASFSPRRTFLTESESSYESEDVPRSCEIPVSYLSALGTKVRLNRHPSTHWIENLKDRFDRLTSLPRGWDGYTGMPVSFTCAHFAATILERLFVDDVPPPTLVPGSDGTIQFEWHRNQYDVEVDILGPYEIVALRRNLKTNVVEERELNTDLTCLSDWIASLKDGTSSEMGPGA